MTWDDLSADATSDLCPACLEDGEIVPVEWMCLSCDGWACLTCAQAHECEENR